MSSPSPPITRLRTRALRDAVYAPEIERLLDRRFMDLAVMDQVDAVYVRLQEAVRIFEARIDAALRLGRRLRKGLFTALGAPLVGVWFAARLLAAQELFVLELLLMLTSGALATAIAVCILRLERDLRLLRRLARNFSSRLEGKTSMSTVLDFCQSVLESTRTLAGREDGSND